MLVNGDSPLKRAAYRAALAHSPALTGVVMPEGHDADQFRKVVLENFDMSLGTGLNKIKGKVFRIGHLGSLTAPSI